MVIDPHHADIKEPSMYEDDPNEGFGAIIWLMVSLLVGVASLLGLIFL
jgi:hypothetical protein